jgi:5,10-methenyltetrahydromethanopterin hydrogenase
MIFIDVKKTFNKAYRFRVEVANLHNFAHQSFSIIGIEEKEKLIEIAQGQNPFGNNPLVRLQVHRVEVDVPKQFLS